MDAQIQGDLNAQKNITESDKAWLDGEVNEERNFDRDIAFTYISDIK